MDMRLEIRDPEVRAALLKLITHVRSGGNGPMRDDYRRAAARFLGFIRARFVRASRGDGTWPPLAYSTRLRKLRRGLRNSPTLRAAVRATGSGQVTRAQQVQQYLAEGPFPILRETGLLFNSLTEGAPGSVVNYEFDGVRVGTAVRYADFHQDPTVPGRPPKREIFVQPDAATEAAITNDLANGLLKVLDADTAGGSGGGTA